MTLQRDIATQDTLTHLPSANPIYIHRFVVGVAVGGDVVVELVQEDGTVLEGGLVLGTLLFVTEPNPLLYKVAVVLAGFARQQLGHELVAYLLAKVLERRFAAVVLGFKAASFLVVETVFEAAHAREVVGFVAAPALWGGEGAVGGEDDCAFGVRWVLVV